MERDRYAVLISRAAARGRIDFRRARLLDPAWWRWCDSQLRELEAEDDLAILECQYRKVLALLGNSALTPESFTKGQEEAGELLQKIISYYRPWHKQTQAAYWKSEVEQLYAIYEKATGQSLRKKPARKPKRARKGK